MTGADKNEWDRFQTVGKQLDECQRQGSWIGWAGLVLLGSLLGFIIFPVVVLVIGLTYFSFFFSTTTGIPHMNYGFILLRSILEDRPGRERMQVLGLMALMFIIVGAGVVLGLHVGETVSPKAGWLTCIGLVNLGVAIALGSLELLRRRRDEHEEHERREKMEKIRQIREQILDRAMNPNARLDGQDGQG